MGATINVECYDGTAPGTAHALDTGSNPVKFSTIDTWNDTANPITIPSGSTRTFSMPRQLCLFCSAGGGASTLSNVKIAVAASPALNSGTLLGLHMFWKRVTTYVTATKPADDTQALTAAAGSMAAPWALMPDDSAYVATGGLGGATTTGARVPTAGTDFVQVVVALTSAFADGGGNKTLPQIKFQYDEAA